MPTNDEITNTATAVDSTEVSPAAQPGRLEPGSKLGRYEIGEVIGAGGMGVVYRARDPELNRDVAIKIVGSHGGRSQERLLAEARAMAKLDHPSLMPVFDVGALENGVFVVMPYLTGGTLHDWIHAQPRPWREVVARFIKAGRGLAAAHSAGLVHRDFKPRNVLLDGDDVLVADFGLVAGGTDATSGGAVDASLIAGTPGYMAPEQAHGDAIDARADQFSFCISLWEGLHDQRPQEATTRTRDGLAAGSLPPVPPDRRDSPAWLRQIVARGFSVDPADRWPSIDALLEKMTSGLERRRSAALAAIGVAAAATAVTGAVWFASTTERPVSCTDRRAHIDNVWGAPPRAEIEAIIQSSGVTYAKPVMARVFTTLDERANAWRAATLDTCRAHRSGRESATVHDLRMRCLDRWLGELGGAVSLLRRVKDSGSLDAAANATRALSSVDVCASEKSLAAETPPPSEQQSVVAALEAEIQSMTTDRRADKAPVAELLERAKVASEKARSTAHPPTLVRALRLLAALQRDAQDVVGARATLEEMAKTAASQGDDRSAAFAWTEVAMVTGAIIGRPAEARLYLPAAHAAVIRAGNEVSARVSLMYTEAMVIDDDGEPERALALLQGAQTLLREAGAEEAGSPLSGLNVSVAMAIGAAHGAARRYDESLAAFHAALMAGESLYGADHPWLAPIHYNIGETHLRAHRMEAALGALRRSAELREKGQGETPVLVTSLARVADCLVMLDRLDESLVVNRRAYEIAERVTPPGDRLRLSLLESRAHALRRQDKQTEALTLFDEVIRQYEAKDPTPKELVTALHNRAGTLRELGHYERSIQDYQRTLALRSTFPIFQKTGGASRIGLGLSLIFAKRPAEAIAPLEEAINDTTPGRDTKLQNIARWLVGRARVESGLAVSRGLDEVRAARTIMIDGGARPEEVEELDTWLAEQALASRRR